MTRLLCLEFGLYGVGDCSLHLYEQCRETYCITDTGVNAHVQLYRQPGSGEVPSLQVKCMAWIYTEGLLSRATG